MEIYTEDSHKFIALKTIEYAVRDAIDPRRIAGDKTPPWKARQTALSFLRGAAAGRDRLAVLVFAIADLDPERVLRLVEEKIARLRAAGEEQFEQLSLFDYSEVSEVG